MSGADHLVHYRSLDEVVTAVDLVVRGRITDVWLAELEPIDDEEGIQYVRATLTIDEVLRGTARTQTDGTL